MLYEMGRRYDEWQGENYEGTSLRGAMKGWHKHGVATEDLWPYRVKRGRKSVIDQEFTPERARDAARRPIGAYYRILDSDVSHVQAAITEADAVLASAWVHSGWQNENLLDAKGTFKQIRRQSGKQGLHAFAIVGYTPEGFIIQNSWGPSWGANGRALLSYDDWFENRQDAWVARLGPQTLDSKGEPRIFTVGFVGRAEESKAGTVVTGLGINPLLLPYLINTGDRGELSTGGRLITREEELPDMARKVMGSKELADGYRHIVLYAHGGLNSEATSLQTANRLWGFCNERSIVSYFFIWETGISESVLGWLRSDDDASGPTKFSFHDVWENIKKGTGTIIRDSQKYFGKKLAPIAREVFWDEMKGRAEGSASKNGGANLFVQNLLGVMKETPSAKFKLHLIGHSAGSIYLGWLYQNVLSGLLKQSPNVKLASVQFMAPALSIRRTQEAFYLDRRWAVSKKDFRIYMLNPKNEERDSIKIYPSSLLTYVADHLESPNKRVPLLGLRTDFEKHVDFAEPVAATFSTRHGEFDEPRYEVEQILNGIAEGGF
ncbi:MAG TPA: C1 family peptidase [Verrucomicrobiae bacterium]|nr:C1 family peptidase [Verrucomicrobiae bacterium]